MVVEQLELIIALFEKKLKFKRTESNEFELVRCTTGSDLNHRLKVKDQCGFESVVQNLN